MFRLKRSPRWRYRKCYILLSALSVFLIICYSISSDKKNLMLLTFFKHKIPNYKRHYNYNLGSAEGSDDGSISTQIYQNLRKKHVVDSNKQLRDWHSNAHTNRLQVTRDHLQTTRRSTSNRFNNQQQRQQRNTLVRKSQDTILSFDASDFGQMASKNSTYNLKLIENTNNNSKSNNNNNDRKLNSSYTYNKKSLQLTGFNVELSESLPLVRLLPDTRHKSCQWQLYPAHLPLCSIIVIYHNENLTVLLRTLHSITHRTPRELFAEIILIDDYSETNDEIDEHIKNHFPDLVKLIHLTKRQGLIRARLEGAKAAVGQVLVFLDAHVEVNENWLPPLLAPLEENGETCTTPIIDIIKYDTLEYVGSMPSRGGFNWQFNYVQLPLLKEEEALLPQPHNNPIMNGGLFAIKRDYFWLLGGYDEGLEIWGAEQFELSFKIWMCGGGLLEVPCSRVGHLYRDPDFKIKYSSKTEDFISKNYKRVAEVWLDEYRDYLYEHVPKLNQIQAGNFSAQKQLRSNLKCKSFKWFLQNIAFDLLKAYPPIKPSDFASGAIQSQAVPQLCIDLSSTRIRQPLRDALKPCSPDPKYPYAAQKFYLSFRHDLRHQENCLEVQTWSSHAPVWLWPCHNLSGNQYWYYDRTTQMLVQGKTDFTQRCLDMDRESLRIFVNYCDFAKPEQKWLLGYVNHTAMAHFFEE